VRNLFATSAQLEAAVQQRQTDLAAAQSDLARRQRLGASGAVSGEELQHAIDAVRAAQAALLAARQQLAANRARVDGTTLTDHPQVRDAAAAVRNAYLTLARTELPAPVAGFVARRNVQLGQRVSPGTALMAVVPLDQVWVDANFKEPQLERMRVGQPVRVTADLYGTRVLRSEEHTSELQSLAYLVCRLLLEKKKTLPRVRDMGSDILYFPPTHPIGPTHRKGRNNALNAGPTAPGPPYAIGGTAACYPALLTP